MTENIIKATGLMFLHSLWQGMLIAALAGLLLIITRNTSPAFRYRLLCTCFISFIVACCYTFIWQYDRFSNSPGITYAAHSNLHSATSSSPGIINSIIEWCTAHSFLIVGSWFIVFLVKLMSMTRALVLVKKLKDHGTLDFPLHWEEKCKTLLASVNIRRRVLFQQSTLVTQPMVIGFLKPVLLMPVGLLSNLPYSEVEAILLHELAHIKRNDFFINLLQSFAEIIFFFNPGVWLISSLIRKEREYCCDHFAVERLGNKTTFIRALLSVHKLEPRLQKYTMALNGPHSFLSQRVHRIVHSSNKTHNMEKFSAIILASVMVILFASFSFTNHIDTKQKKTTAGNPPATPFKNSFLNDAIQVKQQSKSNITDTPEITGKKPAPGSFVRDTIPKNASKEYIEGFKAGMNYRDHPFGDTALEKIERGLVEATQQKTGQDDKTLNSLLSLFAQNKKKEEEELKSLLKTGSFLSQPVADKKRIEELLRQLKKVD